MEPDGLALVTFGATLGATIAVIVVVSVWRILRKDGGAPSNGHARKISPPRPRTPRPVDVSVDRASRPTAQLKVGVVPFGDRPTLVHAPRDRSECVQTVVSGASDHAADRTDEA